MPPTLHPIRPEALLETRLAGFWQELLGVSTVAPDDDFFSLGGNSLQAIQLVTWAREHLGVTLSLRQVFYHPTLGDLAAAVAATTSTANVGPALRPQPLPRDQALPLAAPQRRLWYLDQLQRSTAGVPGDISYNMVLTVSLAPPCNRQAMKRSLEEIVRRHEVLRTRLVLIAGEPRQVIDLPRSLPLPMVDLGGLTPTAWQSVARKQAERFLRCPFDLARDLMLRALVLRGPGPDAAHWMVLVLHHIAADGWSIGVLLYELATLYPIFRAHPDAVSPLPPLLLQYADLARYQEDGLTESRLAQLLAFWQTQLSDAPPQLELPSDRTRSRAAAVSSGGESPVNLTTAQVRPLVALAKASGATLFMTLLAVLSALLHRLSGQRDLLLSAPTANRLHPATEPLIGFFTNMLVLRVNWTAGTSCRGLLAAVRETCLEAFAHQDLPFDRLVEALRPDRQSGQIPWVQAGFALQNAFRSSRSGAELTVIPLPLHTGKAHFDLSLSLMESADQLLGSFEYRQDLFDPTTIARWATSFAVLAAGFAAQPDLPVDQLPALPAPERHHLLVELGQNERAYALDHCLHDLVAQQIDRTPAGESVRFAGQALTYHQLGAAACQLAQQLQDAGVRVGDPVGLLLDRSLELPSAFLAVLLAGGVCVPLDPSLPQERLAFLLADTQAITVVTQSHLQPGLPAGWAGQCISVDDLAFSSQESNPVRKSQDDRQVEVDPQHLAYIVYTSGSTGRPKGVRMTHCGLCNRLLWQQEDHPLGSGDRVLQNLSIGFDAAIWQVFGPLIAGAAVVLPRPGGHLDMAYLAELIVQEGITAADFVPSVLTQLLEEPALGHGSRLRQVVSGGEPLGHELATRVLAQLPQVSLINVYGPTETSLTIATHLCARAGHPLEAAGTSDSTSDSTPGAVAGTSSLPIGRPIANTPTYVLDRRGNPAPWGAVGEIHAGGLGITAGYLRRPGLTAERFVPDPFASAPGQRLYRTGDLARWLSPGLLEFLGRTDHQVKIRGVRIELGEIEAQLRRLNGMRDAVVLARQDVSSGDAAPGEKRLVAYVVADAPAASPTALRQALRQALPLAMVPSLFVFLDALPLNLNGKVDRRALPAPSASSGNEQPMALPRDPLELELTQIWSETLGLSAVSTTASFFDLGGHSLLAVKLMSEIRQRLDVHLDLAELYAASTIADMAQLLRGRSRAPLPGTLVALRHGRPGSNTAPLFCVHTLDGMVHSYGQLALALTGDGPVYGLEAPGLHRGALPPADFTALAAQHVAVLNAFLPLGEVPFFLCGWSVAGLLAHEMAYQLEQQGRPPAGVFLLDTHPQLDRQPTAVDAATRQALFAHLLLGLDPGQLGQGLGAELDEPDFLDHLLTVARDRGRLAAATDREFVQRRFAVLSQILNGSLAYRPRVHSSPLIWIRASLSPDTVLPTDACRALTTGPFAVHTVAGDHHALLRAPGVAAVAEQIFATLAVAERPAEELLPCARSHPFP